MNNKPIGILDSGVGGLSVYREVVALLPHESTIYIGDSAFAPYGKLTEEAIFERASKVVRFLLEKQVKLIVVACNTITVSCIDKLRTAFPQVPIIGTVPVVKTAAAQTQTKCFGILSTTRTASSTYQKDLIKAFADGKRVLNLGTDDLVPLIEQGILEGEQIEAILEKVLAPYKKEHIDILALGCTHFPFIRDGIQKVLGKDVKILDSGDAIARQVKRILSGNESLNSAGKLSREFYATGSAEQFDRFAKKVLDATIASKSVSL